MKRRYFIETFGCQMNVNDSEKVAGTLQAQGYDPVDRVEAADVVFINTCAVRERAAEKLFHALGRLRKRKRARKDFQIAVGGCVAQLHGRSILDRAPDVDVLVGTHTLARVPELLEESRNRGTRAIDLDRDANAFSVPPERVAHTNAVRAFITVMEGCNHVCSFCVVPRTRGPEVNRPPADVVAEAESVVARGVPEVMLLGQTVNAYRYQDLDFVGLLARVHAVPGLRRLRFTTSHPEHVTVSLARAWRELPRLCPYLHLPVQSGSDRVLASMRRGYTRAHYLDQVAMLRAESPQLAISTDIIVGYPGESASDFEATVSLVDQVGFDALFAFAYSARPGTTAQRLPDDVPEDEKRRRLQVLNALQQRRQALRNARRVGEQVEILVEESTLREAVGRTPDFRVVHAVGHASPGEVARVSITASGPNSLRGELTPTNSLTVGSAVPIL